MSDENLLMDDERMALLPRTVRLAVAALVTEKHLTLANELAAHELSRATPPGAGAVTDWTAYDVGLEAAAQLCDLEAAEYPHNMKAAVKTHSNAGAGDAIGSKHTAERLAAKIRANKAAALSLPERKDTP